MSKHFLTNRERPSNPFLLLLVKHALIFEKGSATVANETVEKYLAKAKPFIAEIIQKAAISGVDPAMVEIWNQFLHLTDERHEDGSVERRMLSYHTRVCFRLDQFLKGRSDDVSDGEVVNMMTGLNFNKPSAVAYYQQKVPVWVALKEMPNPHTKVIPSAGDVAFNPFQESIEKLIQAIFFARGTAYNDKAPSLKDSIKASVEVSMAVGQIRAKSAGSLARMNTKDLHHSRP